MHRDYSLDAHDDAAQFDLGNDLSMFWVARRQVEETWEDKGRLYEIFRSYGIRDEQHFYQVQATVDRFIAGVRLENAMQRDANAFHAILREYDIRDQSQGDRLIATAQRYAPHHEQRQRFGYDLGSISQMQANALSQYELQCGKAFSDAGQGQAPPITLEQWVEIQEAQSAASRRGQDVSQVLAHYGMNPLGWSNASMWWSAHFSQNAMNNGGELHRRFSELSTYFQQRFAG